jgi:predicted dehydrogenase
MKKFKVGIIGTGFGAKVHAPQMNFHDGFEVVAVSSVSRGNLEEARKISGVENVYNDWQLMLEKEQLDLVVVASAVFLHKEMVTAAYKKGIHVLCEKPMALDTNETEEMITGKEHSGKLGLINHEFRFLPARMKVKEIIQSKQLGEIMHVRYSASFSNFNALTTRPRGWLALEEKGGGMLGAIGSHMTDSLHWWFDSHFKEVFANLPIHVPVQKDENGNIEYRTADDAFQVVGRLENGASVSLDFLSAARQTFNDWRLEVFGKDGTLVMIDDNQVYLSIGDAKLEKVGLVPDITAPEAMPVISARYYNGFHRALDALYETLLTGTKHKYLADFESGHATQKVLDAIRLSAKDGRKIIIL